MTELEPSWYSAANSEFFASLTPTCFLWPERSLIARKKLLKPKQPNACCHPRKKKTSKRKSKSAENLRLKMYWGVFSQNLKRVAVFEFDQQKEALKRAKELSKGGKSPHFVQKVKEEIQLE